MAPQAALWKDLQMRTRTLARTRALRILQKLGIRKFERRELTWLLAGIGVCAFLWTFLSLADEVAEGGTLAFDIKIVRAFRNAADPSHGIGPQWLETAVRDITALGGATVLGLILIAVVGFLLLQARYRTALFVAVTAVSGEVLSYLLKHLFNRARPSVIPDAHLMTPSFPSGHAMESAIMYLTLGAVLMRVSEKRVTKVYCLGLGVFLTAIIGVSRVYLGVHYPTDVVAGWMVGFLWASLCWFIAQHFERRAGIEAESRKAERTST
jgi:undecaprenyl-diphosphatase